MKDFMLVFLGPDYGDLNLSPEQIQERMGRWFSWGDKMEKAGILGGGNALTSQVKRISGTEMTVTDIASADIKELIGGYYIVKAQSFEEAVKIAEDFPDYDLNGIVEVREIMVFDQ